MLTSSKIDNIFLDVFDKFGEMATHVRLGYLRVFNTCKIGLFKSFQHM